MSFCSNVPPKSFVDICFVSNFNNSFTYSEEKISSSLEGVISVANASGDLVPAKDILIWVNIPDHRPSRRPRVEKMNQKNKIFFGS